MGVKVVYTYRKAKRPCVCRNGRATNSLSPVNLMDLTAIPQTINREEENQKRIKWTALSAWVVSTQQLITKPYDNMRGQITEQTNDSSHSKTTTTTTDTTTTNNDNMPKTTLSQVNSHHFPSNPVTQCDYVEQTATCLLVLRTRSRSWACGSWHSPAGTWTGRTEA